LRCFLTIAEKLSAVSACFFKKSSAGVGKRQVQLWSPSVPGVFTRSLEPKMSWMGRMTMREPALSSAPSAFSRAYV